MVKLDPSTGEWFLVQLCLVQVRRLADGAAREGALPLIDAPGLARLLAGLPPGTLADYRRRREYLSSLLAKNELGSTNPYSRRIFLRVRRGAYALCLANIPFVRVGATSDAGAMRGSEAHEVHEDSEWPTASALPASTAVLPSPRQ